ncbi:MAG: Hsp20/alpha crystallin family protein [Nitrospirota bacterium]
MSKKKEDKKELEVYRPSKALSVFEQMDRLFEDFFNRRFTPLLPSLRLPEIKWPAEMEMSPSVDIFDEKDEIVMKAELPGMDKDNVNINVTDNSITISGEKKKEEKVEKKDYYRIERSSGSFSRSFRLPSEIQTDKVKATFKNGVLEVRLPKTEEAKKKEVKVNIE